MTHRHLQRLTTVVLCMIIVAGCVGVPFVGATTPEQAAQRTVPRVDGKPLAVTVAGKRPLPNGDVIVLYHADGVMPDGQATALFGYSVATREGFGWITNGIGTSGGPLPPASDFVNYSSGSSNTGGISEAILYGETLVPDVLAVEATFDNGKLCAIQQLTTCLC